jgi:hypothetical protein
MTLFSNIPQFTDWGSYRVDVDWNYLESHIQGYEEDIGLDLDPDYQRGHVWTEVQQVAYVEFILRGGHSGRDLLFNCSGWNTHRPGTCELVDGKQRLTAARKFMRNVLPIFHDGTLLGNSKPLRFRDFGGRMRIFQGTFKWHVNDLATRADVLRWYLEINSGGTPHTAAELAKVRAMLAAEARPLTG